MTENILRLSSIEVPFQTARVRTVRLVVCAGTSTVKKKGVSEFSRTLTLKRVFFVYFAINDQANEGGTAKD